jgi:hypothetical protein
MRLEDLQIPEQPEVIQKEVEYKGQTVTAFFRVVDALKAQGLFDYMDAKGERDMKKVRSADFRIIAAVCCKEDGSDMYTEDTAKKLPAPLKVQLAKLAIEVNVPQSEGTPKN